MANEEWAKNPNTRPEVLAMLATSPSTEVRELVAQNPATPEAALLHLATDEADSVRRAITQRSHVSSEVLRMALLPREALAQLEQPEPEAPAPAPAAPAPAEAQEAAPAPLPLPAAPAARKPGWLAWFWRLLGRTA